MLALVCAAWTFVFVFCAVFVFGEPWILRAAPDVRFHPDAFKWMSAEIDRLRADTHGGR